MLKEIRVLRRELGIRFKHADIDVPREDWEVIQSGIFELNGTTSLGENLARNAVAAAYDPERAVGNVMSVSAFGHEAFLRVSEVLNRLEVAEFMEVRKDNNGQYGLLPKPEYEGRVAIEETMAKDGVLQSVRIKLQRKQ